MRNLGRKHHTGAGIVVTVILLIAILLLSVYIQNISVTGSNKYNGKQIEEFLFSGRWGGNSAYTYLANRFKLHRQAPLVENYKAVLHSPFQVEVIIYEKNIVEYVSYMSGYMYFGKGGIVVESSGSQLGGVSWIIGLDLGQTMLHRALLAEDKNVFREVPDLTQQPSIYEIVVDRIKYDTHGRTTLPIGQMEVTLGDNSDIDGKTSTLGNIPMAQLHLTGIDEITHLENCSETNSRAGATFEKE